MIVILEGAERTGKTTVAGLLEKHEGFINLKDVPHAYDTLWRYTADTMTNRIDAIVNFLVECSKKDINIVIDRLHISHYVFNKIYRNNKGDTNWRYFDKIMSCLPNVKLCLFERDDVDTYLNELPVNKEEAQKVIKEFHQAFDKSEIKSKHRFHFDLVRNNPQDVIDEIVGHTILSEIEGDVTIERKFKYDFYLASPFFTEEQKERENAVKTILRSRGYRVFAPMENGIIEGTSHPDFCKEIFQANVEAIQDSHTVLAITDGKDMGTIWEAGYAYGIGKPVVYYAETLGKNPFNIMLSESGVGVILSRETLAMSAEEGNFEYKEEIIHE